MRKNSVALGTLVASLPQTTQEASKGVIYDFRERSQAWFEQWLNERDMLLHACVLHLDEKYPHIHGWFTPNLELIEKGEWPLGKTTFPQRAVLQKMQVDFFDSVGQHFYSQRVKPEAKRRVRLDRRTAVRLRDMPETITSHPIHDIGFFNAVLALARIADNKGLEQQANILEAVHFF